VADLANSPRAVDLVRLQKAASFQVIMSRTRAAYYIANV